MHREQQAIDEYEALRPSEYATLESFTVREGYTHHGDQEIEVEMTFYGAGGRRLQILCRGVRDLVFEQPGEHNIRLAVLTVEDIGTPQIEADRFLVYDPEQEEVVRFKSRTFEARLL